MHTPEPFKRKLFTRGSRAICTAALLAASLAVAGCHEADDGDGGDDNGETPAPGAIDDGGPESPFPNDGSTGGTITEGGNPLPGNFVCTGSVAAYGDGASTEVGTGGLVGGPLTALLNALGAAPLAQLLNSVDNPEYAIDSRLDTWSTFSLTFGLLGGLLTTVDQIVHVGDTVPAGEYAVFGVSFPIATLELSLLQSVVVKTFLGETEQESVSIDASALDLLGKISTGVKSAFVGVHTTLPYDTVSIGLLPRLLSVNVGDAMRVHELCTQGQLVEAP